MAASVAEATSLSALAPTDLAALRGQRAAATPQAKEAAAAAAEARATEEAIDLKDPRSWPGVTPNGALPKFASAYESMPVCSANAAADEFLLGAEGKPAVRDLEAAYSPSIRTGSKLTGRSTVARKFAGRSARTARF
jgi:hypothetical protein